MIFDLLNNASYNYIQRKYYITKMEKSYEYWRIACQRDNRFIILFFLFPERSHSGGSTGSAGASD